MPLRTRRPRALPWAAALAATLAVAGLAAAPASGADDTGGRTGAPARLADVQPFLADELAGATAGAELAVLVHGRTLGAATRAVSATGMTPVTTFDRIAVAVATGTPAQVRAARGEPGVTYLEGNQPLAFTDTTSHRATRGVQAAGQFDGTNGSPLDGTGTSVGVIDSGIDPTHPFFAEPDGSSAVVANLKVVCDPLESTCEVVRVPDSLDTDTTAAGGHGTHVSGIVAGRPTRLIGGGTVRGAAPDASLVSLSTGAILFILGSDAALNWVLENHEHPCGAGVPRRECPPIEVTNNSYGPLGGGSFDPRSATVKLQRALAAEGVLTVWANGNDGGDGSENLSNPPGQDPTAGIVSVASYFDQDTGTRAGVVSDYSSRGRRGQVATYPDLSAPGENITSSCRPSQPICSTGLDPRDGPAPTDVGTFNTISGTSMAAPHVAGIIAQLLEGSPRATPGQLERALKLTALRYTDGAAYQRDPRGGLTSFDKGHGLVDVVAAHRFLTAP